MSSLHLELIHQAAAGVAHSAPPLLFIHGAYSSASCWQVNFLPWFAAQGYDCWALSLEGHGHSDGKDWLAAVSIDDYVANVGQAIRQIGTMPVLIGHSMGGFVAQQYLQQHRAAGLVLLASVPHTGLAASTWRLFQQAPDVLIGLNMFQSGRHSPAVGDLRHMLFSDDAPASTVAWMAANSQVESLRAIMDMSMVSPFSRTQLRVPTLLLGGEHDHLVSATEVRQMGRALGLHHEILPAMAHMMMLDTRWQQVALRIDQWLQQHLMT